MIIEEYDTVELLKDYEYEDLDGNKLIYKAGSIGQIVNVIDSEYVTVEFSYKEYSYPVPDVPIAILKKQIK